MNDIISHVTRLSLVLPLLILLTPILGKRALSDAHLMDFLLVTAIAETSAITLMDTGRPLFSALITVAALGLFYWLFSLVTLRYHRFRHLLFRGPSVVIEKGQINRKAMSQNYLSVESLLGMLRAKGAYSVADVEFAVLEEDGQLSVMKKPELEPVTRQDMKVKGSKSDLMVAVVVDGTPVESALDYLGLDKKWLDHQLRDKGITLDQALLVTANKQGGLQVAKTL